MRGFQGDASLAKIIIRMKERAHYREDKGAGKGGNARSARRAGERKSDRTLKFQAADI